MFICILLILTTSTTTWADWSIDFSRRTNELRKKDLETPKNAKKEPGIFDSFFDSAEPVQELVIMNTKKGFIPSTINVKTDRHYKINVVNINEDDKNVSFVLDAFSEHHATYYGQLKTFMINPKKEGIYSFQCPETSAQGRLIVYPGKDKDDLLMRAPASEN